MIEEEETDSIPCPVLQISSDVAVLAFLSLEQGTFPLRSLELGLWRARLESFLYPYTLPVIFLVKSSIREAARKASL